MRLLRVLGLILLIIAAADGAPQARRPTPEETEDPVAGDWTGALEIPGQPLALGVTFDDDSATLSIPAQSLFAHPLAQVHASPEKVAFVIPGLPGTPAFQGHYDAARSMITGTFTQSGHDLPLTLHRGTVPVPPRPQEPAPPWPYRSTDVTYRSGDIAIAGTLTLPSAPGPHPAVILLNGSGKNDRNEEVFGHKPFLLLADTLTRAGYAVLRTDKRGVGGTGGVLADATYNDLAGDVVAGVDFLRSQRDIDPDLIGLLGHSEGGFLAPLVAAEPRNRIAFMITMAGPAASGKEVLLAQNRALLAVRNASADEVAAQIGFVDTLTTLLLDGDPDRARQYAIEHNAALPPEQRQPESAVERIVNANFASFVGCDPAAALRALRMPVLAFYGSMDLQVPVDQNAPLARTLLAADPDADVHVFDGLNHLMQPATTGSPNEYGQIEITIAPEVLAYVTDWLGRRVPPVITGR
ncbi:S9 family peptidase [Nocardia sp. CA2R105]|uniref:alpha/beta hydrolase family protein n=1 Tax=Nocardia coffeae TaxID=2873381 RepID=UPI001CA6654B|nr:alpha/beta fold hydrolase [Nocardia coffeae]MBY8861654.1 S9 family peptidase [Nocardia coffeae]